MLLVKPAAPIPAHVRNRAEILRQYARHLSDAETLAVAAATPSMAGRDLRDVCEQAERRWASKASTGHGRAEECRGSLQPLGA